VSKRAARKGIALVEYALMLPLLLLLLAGVLNYGMALRTATAVAMAARSGAQYGSGSLGRAGDSAGIRAAAVNSAPDVAAMTVSSAKSCQCSGGGSVSCWGTCAGGKMLVYVQVTAQATATTFFDYPSLGFTGNVSSRATLRVQ